MFKESYELFKHSTIDLWYFKLKFSSFFSNQQTFTPTKTKKAFSRFDEISTNKKAFFFFSSTFLFLRFLSLSTDLQSLPNAQNFTGELTVSVLLSLFPLPISFFFFFFYFLAKTYSAFHMGKLVSNFPSPIHSKPNVSSDGSFSSFQQTKAFQWNFQVKFQI